jgi:hypothetical protein
MGNMGIRVEIGGPALLDSERCPLVSLTATMCILGYGAASRGLEWNRCDLLALGIGTISALASIACYNALKLGPVSVILGFFLLHNPIAGSRNSAGRNRNMAPLRLKMETPSDR